MSGSSDHLGAWTGHVIVDVNGRYMGARNVQEEGEGQHSWYPDLVDRVWIFRDDQMEEARQLAAEVDGLLVEVLATITVMDRLRKAKSN